MPFSELDPDQPEPRVIQAEGAMELPADSFNLEGSGVVDDGVRVEVEDDDAELGAVYDEGADSHRDIRAQIGGSALFADTTNADPGADVTSETLDGSDSGSRLRVIADDPDQAPDTDGGRTDGSDTPLPPSGGGSEGGNGGEAEGGDHDEPEDDGVRGEVNNTEDAGLAGRGISGDYAAGDTGEAGADKSEGLSEKSKVPSDLGFFMVPGYAREVVGHSAIDVRDPEAVALALSALKSKVREMDECANAMAGAPGELSIAAYGDVQHIQSWGALARRLQESAGLSEIAAQEEVRHEYAPDARANQSQPYYAAAPGTPEASGMQQYLVELGMGGQDWDVVEMTRRYAELHRKDGTQQSDT